MTELHPLERCRSLSTIGDRCDGPLQRCSLPEGHDDGRRLNEPERVHTNAESGEGWRISAGWVDEDPTSRRPRAAGERPPR